MISDLRVIDEPLAKSICRTWGVVHRRAMLPADLFTTGSRGRPCSDYMA
jgi:hypothetical protein